MASKRFEVIHEQTSWGMSHSFTEIVDRETGVHYLLWKSGHGGGITPLLDASGKPVTTPIDKE